MNMSLDDYIKANAKKSLRVYDIPKTEDYDGFDEEELDFEPEIESVEEDKTEFKEEVLADDKQDVSMEKADEGVKGAPLTAGDLRNKLDQLAATSPQYRLIQPNVQTQRPRGMPALAPRGAFNNDNNNGFPRPKKRNWNPRYRANRWKNNNNENRDRIPRTNFKNNQTIIRRVSGKLPDPTPPKGQIKICLGNARNDRYINAGRPEFKMSQLNLINSQAQALLDQQTVGPNGSTLSLLDPAVSANLPITAETIPILTASLMASLGVTANQAHKPVYDMRIQKEIHEIQNKPLSYMSGNGQAAVCSSDGPGINLRITPDASDISMNCRFT